MIDADKDPCSGGSWGKGQNVDDRCRLAERTLGMIDADKGPCSGGSWGKGRNADDRCRQESLLLGKKGKMWMIDDNSGSSWGKGQNGDDRCRQGSLQRWALAEEGVMEMVDADKDSMWRFSEGRAPSHTANQVVWVETNMKIGDCVTYR